MIDQSTQYVLQANRPCKVERDPYTGPVVEANIQPVSNAKTFTNPILPEPGSAAFYHNRPKTSSGGRNLHDSSFALSGKIFNKCLPVYLSHTSCFLGLTHDYIIAYFRQNILREAHMCRQLFISC